MARQPAPDVKITEALAPAATLHDTYWRPATPEPSPLHQVAKALSSLSDDLASTGAKMEADQAEAVKGTGTAAFYFGESPGNTGLTDSGAPAPSPEGIAAGHRSGLLPIWGKTAMRLERERDAAAGYGAGLPMQGRIMEKYNQLPMDQRMNMTPEQLDQWVLGEIRSDPAGSAAMRSPGFARGIGPQVRELHSQVTARWMHEKNKDAEVKLTTAWGSAITSSLEASAIDGKTREGGPDYSQIASNMEAFRTAGFKAGRRQDEIDKQIASSIIDRASLDRDPSLLGVLDRLKGPGGRPLSSVPEIQAAKNAATTSIASLREQDRARAQSQLDRENKLAHDGSLRNITEGFLKDNNFSPDPKDVANVYRRDPKASATILELRKNIAEGKGFEDPDVIRSMLGDIYSKPGQGWDILRKGAGDIKTAETLKKVRDAVISMETYKQQDSKLFETQSWKRLEAFILDAGKPPTIGGSAFREPSQTPATAQALLDVKMAALKWLNTPEGKNAGQLERERFIAGLQKDMFTALQDQQYVQPPAFREPAGAPSGPGAPTPAGNSGNAPASPSVPANGNPSFLTEGTNSTAPAPAVKPWIQDLANSPDAPPRWEDMKGLGSEYRKDVENIAAKTGKDPQWVIDTMWKRLRGNIGEAQRAMPTQQPQAAPPVAQPPVPQVPQQQGALTIPGLGSINLAGLDQNALREVASQVMRRVNLGPEGLHVKGFGTVHFTPEAGRPAEGSGAFPVQEASFNPGEPSKHLAMAATDHGIDLDQVRFRELPVTDSGIGGPSVGSGSNEVAGRRVARINHSASGKVIDRVASSLRFDPNVAKAIADIESSGNPNASTGSYHGLFQLSAAEFQQYGPKDGRSIMDPEANAIAGLRSMQAKSERFHKEFGRDPNATELYLMHQQGEGGLRAHASHPERLAWQSMLSTGEGRRKGEGWAKKAVWGNVPSDMKKMFGSVENMTSAQFIAVWMTKLQGIPFRQALALAQGINQQKRDA